MKKLLSALVLTFGLFVLGACDTTDEFEISVESDWEDAEFTIEPDTVVEDGEEATITASEEVGDYTFAYWEDADTGATLTLEPSYTFVVEADRSFIAVYEEKVDVETYEITLESDHADADLAVTPEAEVEEGEEVTISASEIDDYVFMHWIDTATGDVFSEEMEYTFTVEEDMTLEAVYSGEAEAAAEQALSDFEGDLGHLQELKDNFEASDAYTVEWMMLFEEEDFDDPDIVHTYQIEWSQGVIEGDTVLTETKMTLTMPDEESFDFHMIVEETEQYYEIYMDVGFLVDELADELEMDVRELFDFEGDYAYMFLPVDDSENFVEEFAGMILADLEDEGIDPEGLEDALEELERFEKYMTLEYYNDHEHLEVEADVVNDTEMMTTIVFNPDMMQDLFEDVFKDVYHVAKALDGEEELPPYEDFIDSDEYQEMLDEIAEIEPFELSLIHEPYSSESMRMEMDMLEMMEDLDEEFVMPGVETMEFHIEMKAYADIGELPETNDIIEIAEELLQLAIMVDTFEYGLGIYADEEIEAGTYTLADLEDKGHFFEIPLMDLEQSEVEVIVEDEEREIVFDFIFATNEEAVFHEPTSLEEIGAVLEEEPETREDFEAIIDYVDESSIAMYLILEDLIEMILEEMQPPVLPEEDLMGEDFEALSRYPDSVIVHYEETAEHIEIVYGAETTLESAYDFYEDYFGENPWTVHHEESNLEEGYFVFSVTHEDYEDYQINLFAGDHSEYQDAITITANIEDVEAD